MQQPGLETTSEKGKKMLKTTSSMIPFRRLEIKQDHKPYTA